MSNYIKKLIRQGEHQQLDFKYAINDSKKIARSLVAFANTDGGKLLIGVKDNGSIAGIKTEEEYYMTQAAAQLYSRPEIHFEPKDWQINGKTVLEINVPKSKIAPHYAKNDEGRWLAYIRRKDKNLLANSVLLKVMKQQKNRKPILIKYSDKEKILLDYLEKNEYISISKFIRLAYLSKKHAENILVKLTLLNIIKIDISEKKIVYRLEE